MNYRLIRFSKNGDVELDAKVPMPNARGDNEVWRQATDGTAFLYDYSTKCWYKLTEGPIRFTTWIEIGDTPLPKYVEMIQLVGSL